ncbi:MAG: hypothetical protein LQ351_000503 [Letrouitia transgressa]|nr:MAG: hypothetical protein LQ351_000503 [Letrouitia transgressa]
MSGHDRDLSEMLEEYMPDFSAVSHEMNKVADYIDSVSDSISSALRESIDHSSWIPASMRKPSVPPPRAPAVATPLGYLGCSRDWISRHRAVTVAVACFFGTGFFLIWRRRKANRAKRRARRAKNGQRTEVVVLAGSPHAPMTRSLSLDLERRGFVVYIPVNSLSEERLIQAEAKTDIRPLHLDVTEPTSLSSTIEKFTTLLSAPPRSLTSRSPTGSAYPLHLASFLLLPQTPPQLFTSPISFLSPTSWSDTFTTHLLSPFTTLQAFLPLLISQASSLLLLTPSITASLNPPNHAPENVVSSALNTYISTLRKELAGHPVNVTQFKLGAFDYRSDTDAHNMQVALRHSAGPQSSSVGASSGGEQWASAGGAKGSSLRELHLEVFDAIVGKRTGTVFVGKGSRVYDIVGQWVPEGMVGWMLGLRSRKQQQQPQKMPKKEERDAHARGEREAQSSREWEKVEERG